MRDTPQSRYDEKYLVRVVVKVNRKTEADILTWITEQENKQGAIKALIRERIRREGKNIISPEIAGNSNDK